MIFSRHIIERARFEIFLTFSAEIREDKDTLYTRVSSYATPHIIVSAKEISLYDLYCRFDNFTEFTISMKSFCD